LGSDGAGALPHGRTPTWKDGTPAWTRLIWTIVGVLLIVAQQLFILPRL
jgi:hypothetical protein